MNQEKDFDSYRNHGIKIVAPLAMAYIPMQKFKDLYPPEKGFDRGTIFKELDLPWEGGGS